MIGYDSIHVHVGVNHELRKFADFMFENLYQYTAFYCLMELFGDVGAYPPLQLSSWVVSFYKKLIFKSIVYCHNYREH